MVSLFEDLEGDIILPPLHSSVAPYKIGLSYYPAPIAGSRRNSYRLAT